MASATASFQGGTVSELESWLSSHGVDTSQYGRGHAKPLSLLLDEVADGETTLALVGGAPLRHVSVVNVTVRGAGGRSLVEARQVLPSGAVRPREMPLSEKMLPGEAWRAAVARGVAEELGAVLPAGHVLTLEEETYREEVEEKESQSYPGLRSRVGAAASTLLISVVERGVHRMPCHRADSLLPVDPWFGCMVCSTCATAWTSASRACPMETL
jgi:hypothetical protein